MLQLCFNPMAKGRCGKALTNPAMFPFSFAITQIPFPLLRAGAGIAAQTAKITGFGGADHKESGWFLVLMPSGKTLFNSFLICIIPQDRLAQKVTQNPSPGRARNLLPFKCSPQRPDEGQRHILLISQNLKRPPGGPQKPLNARAFVSPVDSSIRPASCRCAGLSQ